MGKEFQDNYLIRTMSLEEVDFAIELARKEGWNPGLADGQCFYRTDPDGFLIGTSGGKPVGCISAVSYGQQFGFIGFYVVLPEYRGKGYGIRLWQTAVKRLAGQNSGLDGVIAQEDNYIRSGFTRAYRNFRFEGNRPALVTAVAPEIISLREMPISIIAEYDRQCFPADRQQFLRCWLDQPSARALGYLKNDRLQGYGVIRRCYQGFKIGPLFADNEDIAEALYLHLTAGIEKAGPVYLDVPEVNPQALKLAEKYKMREVFATTRMYSKGRPQIALEKVFGVTTFELG